MHVVTRRQFIAGVSCSLPMLPGHYACASELDQARIAIIDTSDDASTRVSELKAYGVQVVARYFARERQSRIINKRVAYNSDQRRADGNPGRRKGPAEHELLFSNGVALLSVYQYMSNKPHKFLFGIRSGKFNMEPGGPPLKMAEAEAVADARAANEQAKWLDQPHTAPIYFGLDFNLIQGDRYASHTVDNKKVPVVYPGTRRPIENSALIEACQKYFETLTKHVNHPLGVYGNGFANRHLRREKLVTYSWVSESRSYDQTAEFLADRNTEAQWHLFQHHIDRRWFVDPAGCTGYDNNGFDFDGDVQNPTYSSIGAWKEGRLFDVSQERTSRIFSQRWVAKRNSIVYKEPKVGQLTDAVRCRERTNEDGPDPNNKNHNGNWDFFAETVVPRNRSVRVFSDDGTWLQVDLNEDGRPDGYCPREHFVASIKDMPRWTS